MNKVIKNLSIYLLIVLVIIALLKYTTPAGDLPEQIKYSKFLDEINQGQIKTVLIQSDGETNLISGEKIDGKQFETKGPAEDTTLYSLLREKQIEWTSEEPPRPGWWASLLTTLLPILLLVFLFFSSCSKPRAGATG